MSTKTKPGPALRTRCARCEQAWARRCERCRRALCACHPRCRPTAELAGWPDEPQLGASHW